MANPTLLDMPIARDGNKNTIPATDDGTTGLLSQQYGWQLINAIPPQQGGKAVKREDFNGALYLLSNLLFYAQKGWQFEWDSNQYYYAGCIVKDTSDGKMYMCLNDVTSTTAPHSDSTNWKLWDLSMLSNYLPLAGGGALTGTSLTWNGNNLGNSAIVAKYIHGFKGYRKTADGLLMQWGKTTISTGGVYNITYPISFANGEEIQFFCGINVNSNGGTPSGTAVRTLSATYPDSINNPVGTSVYINNIVSGSFYTLSWLAVGVG